MLFNWLAPLARIEIVLEWTRWILAVGLILSSAEWLALIRQFGEKGIYNARLVVITPRVRSVRLYFLHYFLTPSAFCFLLAIRILAAAWCIAVPICLVVPLTILAISTLLIHFRCKYGLEGSDQMLLVVTVALWVESIADSSVVSVASIAIIAAQSCLAYFVAGVSKLIGKDWRDGNAVTAIVNTRSFGSEHAAHLLNRFPTLGKALTYLTVFFECSFPIVFICPLPVAVLYLAGGALFHIMNAFVMGLNVFVWAFFSTYPSILYFAYHSSAGIWGITSP